ncbi:MAG: hypothetical protein O9270_17140 [Aquidulcibacter sp.]|uniref:hypothetical protein n=1 Tax=Aquidulcibacter sp. TaxID=2052990 RepID=UPI0022CAB1C1|nr:hypothetical protein [Aquidulcibacter sp.]MCZ8209908.1 hypothetical protein [Aquidulcibacter sp.]
MDLSFSTRTAFAPGYAFAKAVLEFERAKSGVKRRASRVGEADFTSRMMDKSLDKGV